MTAREIDSDDELRAVATAGTSFVITPFYRGWHAATCPHVQTMTATTPKWFAATLAELTDYLQQRSTHYDTAKPIEACSTCVPDCDPRGTSDETSGTQRRSQPGVDAPKESRLCPARATAAC